jgi:stage II sporulation protein D
VSAEAFRGLLGYERVRSARFEWSVEDDGRIRLDGVGAGHGVGLCQAGARGLSARGRVYTEILAHYYPDARLVRLPAETR